jgi:hypothetical protein
MGTPLIGAWIAQGAFWVMSERVCALFRLTLSTT